MTPMQKGVISSVVFESPLEDSYFNLAPGTFAALGITGFVMDGTWTLWELLESAIPEGKHLVTVDGVAVLVDKPAQTLDCSTATTPI